MALKSMAFVALAPLTVQNLHTLHTFTETLKILKQQSPISLYSQYQLSRREYHGHNLYLIPTLIPNNFIHKSTIIWNKLRQILQITDLSSDGQGIKKKLKSLGNRYYLLINTSIMILNGYRPWILT